MKKHLTALFLGAALVAGASGCSGGDDEPAGDATTTTAAGDETTTTEGGGDETTTTEGEGSSDGESLGSVDFSDLDQCIAFAGAYASLGLSILSPSDTDVDLEQTLADLEAASDQLPSDVQDDLDLVVAAFAEVRDGLEEAGIDLSDTEALFDPEIAQQLAGITAPISSTEFNEASLSVTNALNELCVPS